MIRPAKALTFAALTFVGLLFAAPTPKAADFSANDIRKIEAIEDYLNSLKSFAAQFEQNVNGMQPSTGVFYFKRPGKFLWQYENPDRVKLVSGGGLIYFHDDSNNQTNQVPREGIADFLTRSKIKLLDGKFKVEHLKDTNGLLHIGIRLKDESAGDIGNNLTLTFLEGPLQLRQITTTNQFDQPVEVLFYNIRENAKVKDEIFDFTPPQYRER